MNERKTIPKAPVRRGGCVCERVGVGVGRGGE